jgi:hypothetical protein
LLGFENSNNPSVVSGFEADQNSAKLPNGATAWTDILPKFLAERSNPVGMMGGAWACALCCRNQNQEKNPAPAPTRMPKKTRMPKLLINAMLWHFFQFLVSREFQLDSKLQERLRPPN